MTASEFLRLYPLRAPNLMWLLGAGASASSGIPTAGDMIWDFKRRIYCTEERVSLRACADIGDPLLRAKLQKYFDNRGDCPALNSDEEYSHYFSWVFPNEADRRRYIDEMLRSATPSYGFLALAVLMKAHMANLIWTTNFDRNVEDCSASVCGTTMKLVVVGLDTPFILREAIQEGRWPILAKLHGDFQSRKLKNTAEELREQDGLMRSCLMDECKRQGLLVCGYSGRDDSIMDALNSAIENGKGYPEGLFWFSRDPRPSDKVLALISKARDSGIDAHIIEVHTFDELLADIVGQTPNISKEDLNLLDCKARRVTEAPLPPTKGGWPVVRLNAIELVQFPAVCRLVECEIGGVAEVMKCVQDTGAEILATRKKVGVLFFGTDSEATKAFGAAAIKRFDVYTIETRRLYYDSAEQWLVYAGLARALERQRALRIDRKGGRWVAFVDLEKPDQPFYRELQAATGAVSGTVPHTKTRWAEAIELRLSFRLSHLWLLYEPTIWVEKPTPEQTQVVRDFQRERQATRYNQKWNDLLEAWCHVITQGVEPSHLAAFGVKEAADAEFQVANTTAFSRRAYSR